MCPAGGDSKLRLLAREDISLLRQPQRSLTVHYPITRDNGTEQIVCGFRIQYNDALGPTKGGIRIHKSANLEEVTKLAFLMSLKTSLVGLPYGGAKGAIKVNPKKLSKKEHEQVVRGFVRQIAHYIGPDHDIPAPDVNTNAQTMAMMLDEYEKIFGHKEPAAFTGKPFALGGSLGRETATSRGGFYIIEKMFPRPEETTVAIQGFGNVGGHLAEMLHEGGFKITAVSDSSTGIYSKEGLNIPDLVQWKHDEKSFDSRDEKKISNEELLGLDVDLLVPSALGGVITKENAKNIKARVIVEMANAPTDPEADHILKEMEIVVVPDILANSGGVIVSYFEWVQNKAGEQWTKKKVEDKLKKTILPAYEAVQKESSLRPKLDMRTISYLLATKRVLEAEKRALQGPSKRLT